jgi:hypothetical protein
MKTRWLHSRRSFLNDAGFPWTNSRIRENRVGNSAVSGQDAELFLHPVSPDLNPSFISPVAHFLNLPDTYPVSLPPLPTRGE